MTFGQRLFAAFVIWLLAELGYAIYTSVLAMRAVRELAKEFERAFDEEMQNQRKDPS